MKVNYHVYKDYRIANKGTTDEAIVAAGGPEATRLRRMRYSMVSSVYHPERHKLYLGTTNYAGDILLEFDVKTKAVRSCGFAETAPAHQ